MSTRPSHTGSLPLVYGALAPRHPKSPLHVLFVAELGRQKYQVTPLSLPKNIIGEIILVQLLKFRKQGTVWKIRLQPPLEGGLGQPACHNALGQIRAVLPHNAAYELDRGSRLLDAIIPCLGPDRTCMRPVVLRGVTVRQLLYLTLRTEARAVCSICQQRQAPEDARDEPHLFSSCLEVELPPGERCAGCRLVVRQHCPDSGPPGVLHGLRLLLELWKADRCRRQAQFL